MIKYPHLDQAFQRNLLNKCLTADMMWQQETFCGKRKGNRKYRKWGNKSKEKKSENKTAHILLLCVNTKDRIFQTCLDLEKKEFQTTSKDYLEPIEEWEFKVRKKVKKTEETIWTFPNRHIIQKVSRSKSTQMQSNSSIIE